MCCGSRVRVEAAAAAQCLGRPAVGVTEMLRCAKQLGSKAPAPEDVGAGLAKTALAAVAALKAEDLRLGVRGRIGACSALSTTRPEALSRAESKRCGRKNRPHGAPRFAPGLARDSDITWSLVRFEYRNLCVSAYRLVLLQIFRFVTPLCFQVVIDKVLVHRG